MNANAIYQRIQSANESTAEKEHTVDKIWDHNTSRYLVERSSKTSVPHVIISMNAPWSGKDPWYAPGPPWGNIRIQKREQQKRFRQYQHQQQHGRHRWGGDHLEDPRQQFGESRRWVVSKNRRNVPYRTHCSNKKNNSEQLHRPPPSNPGFSIAQRVSRRRMRGVTDQISVRFRERQRTLRLGGQPLHWMRLHSLALYSREYRTLTWSKCSRQHRHYMKKAQWASERSPARENADPIPLQMWSKTYHPIWMQPFNVRVITEQDNAPIHHKREPC